MVLPTRASPGARPLDAASLGAHPCNAITIEADGKLSKARPETPMAVQAIGGYIDTVPIAVLIGATPHTGRPWPVVAGTTFLMGDASCDAFTPIGIEPIARLAPAP